MIRAIAFTVISIVSFLDPTSSNGPPAGELPSSAAQVSRIPVIMYEDAIDVSGLEGFLRASATRFLLIYQQHADSKALSGQIDTASVARYAGERLGSNPSGWAVLDFETPYDEWLLKGPTSPQWQTATDSMVRTIRELRRLYPRVKWTYYGIPGLSFYLLQDGKMVTWSDARPDTKQHEIDRQLAAYGPVLAECDWLAPCIYLSVGNGDESMIARPELRKATQSYVAARVRLCTDFAARSGRSALVIPFACPIYQPGGGARSMSKIPRQILLEDCVRPAHGAGASGMCIWTAGSYYVGVAMADGPDEAFVGEIGGRAAVRRRWATDLGVPESELTGVQGADVLKKMFSTAQIELAELIRETWTPVVPPTTPSPPK